MKWGTPRRMNHVSISVRREAIRRSVWNPGEQNVQSGSLRGVGAVTMGAMARILVTEEIAEGGLERLRAAGHEVQVELDLSRLLDVIKDANALIIRSATQVTAEVLEAGSET